MPVQARLGWRPRLPPKSAAGRAEATTNAWHRRSGDRTVDRPTGVKLQSFLMSPDNQLVQVDATLSDSLWTIGIGVVAPAHRRFRHLTFFREGLARASSVPPADGRRMFMT